MDEIATLGAGCFWCVESIFNELRGVRTVVSGYSGGKTENPTYADVCTGTTGHAEVINVEFDPNIISFDDILRIFFSVHDPTTKDRQGYDTGTQYRSAIFYHSKEQEEIAKRIVEEIDASDLWKDPIVTEIVPFEKFYPAEENHQDYYVNNPNQPYCRSIITPKILKFRREFADRLKD